ncbi:helix-turn-helix domain-containing protein [Mycolicibacterium sp. 050158]|uniref:TetR/AcrR family transcriptional regulator n=1 Tax=Mycolicibacterium sp. 050158 TaxID=3090602 RepID=UPI00299D7AC6|nr:helix-turn-helix domain-containing protein [Mycolicibacterium sp. 050158]MDX1892422.1 helix-turn-helix domain-containing protein [Mycolicibacterium sp. 050158]
MTEVDRPLRADAARNRARVLEVAYETFAAEGLSVPIDEIARRAGVGAGTVYRHFPTKEALFAAVIDDRVRGLVAGGRRLLDTVGPGEALFAFLRDMVGTASADHGLVEALANYGIDVDAAAPGAEAAFLELMGELLEAAQEAGTARRDVGVAEVKALLVVCKATQGYDDEVTGKVMAVIEAGLRAST